MVLGDETIKLNNDEMAVAGLEKIYLIDINNYLILHETNYFYSSIVF